MQLLAAPDRRPETSPSLQQPTIPNYIQLLMDSVDSSGTVRWLNLTENYWVRARPEQIIAAGEALR